MKASLIRQVLTDLHAELDKDFEIESIQVIKNNIKVLYKSEGEEILTYSADIKIVE
jgi:hypothetical protein